MAKAIDGYEGHVKSSGSGSSPRMGQKTERGGIMGVSLKLMYWGGVGYVVIS